MRPNLVVLPAPALDEHFTGGRCLVICDRTASFYPAAALGLGIKLHQLVVLSPTTNANEMWALDQCLRCPGVGAVWADLARLNDHDFRRLQLAAEEGGTLGLLSRPAKVRGLPSWSDVQFLVEPVAAKEHRRFRLEVTRIRSGTPGASMVLELDDYTLELRTVNETHLRRSPSQQVLSADRRRQA